MDCGERLTPERGNVVINKLEHCEHGGSTG